MSSSEVATVPRCLTARAAARVAFCHQTTIWRAVRRGELPARRLGDNGAYRIDRDALDAWMTTTEETP